MNETPRFAKGGFTFEPSQGWESLVLLGGDWKLVAEAKAVELTEKIIKAAPLGPHRTTDEYSIKKNIDAMVEEVDDQWVGYVVIEENPKARHAMLQEEGYRDRIGYRHAGRFYIKGVLEGERIE